MLLYTAVELNDSFPLASYISIRCERRAHLPLQLIAHRIPAATFEDVYGLRITTSVVEVKSGFIVARNML